MSEKPYKPPTVYGPMGKTDMQKLEESAKEHGRNKTKSMSEKPTEWTKVGDAYMLPESGIMYEVLTDIGNIYRGHPMDWGFVPEGEDDTVEKGGETIVKFRSAPPPQAGAEDAETFLQELVHKIVVRIAEWDGFAANSIKGNVIGGMVLDVLQKESYARHIAAKAVEDRDKELTRLVDERIASHKTVTAVKSLAQEHISALEEVRTWLTKTETR